MKMARNKSCQSLIFENLVEKILSIYTKSVLSKFQWLNIAISIAGKLTSWFGASLGVTAGGWTPTAIPLQLVQKPSAAGVVKCFSDSSGTVRER